MSTNYVLRTSLTGRYLWLGNLAARHAFQPSAPPAEASLRTVELSNADSHQQLADIPAWQKPSRTWVSASTIICTPTWEGSIAPCSASSSPSGNVTGGAAGSGNSVSPG